MNKSFVSIGVTIVDIVGFPIDAIPDEEGTEIIQSIRWCVAGTAAAPAVIASRQGLDTTLVGAVGEDDAGRFILDKLRNEGVRTDLIQTRSDMPTAATILPINSQGGRPNWHMPGAFLLLDPSDDIEAAITNADHVHWGGIGLLFNFDGDVAASLLKKAKANGATTTADLIAPGDHTLDCIKSVAPHLDFFMPSIDEALELSGTDKVEAAADFFMELGASGCIIKCGSQGAYVATREGLSEMVAVMADVKVVDTSGCGDSFCAGFNNGLAAGFDPVKAARFGAATAAQVASGVGSDAGVVDFDTTLKIMNAGSMSVCEVQA